MEGGGWRVEGGGWSPFGYTEAQSQQWRLEPVRLYRSSISAVEVGASSVVPSSVVPVWLHNPDLDREHEYHPPSRRPRRPGPGMPARPQVQTHGHRESRVETHGIGKRRFKPKAYGIRLKPTHPHNFTRAWGGQGVGDAARAHPSRRTKI